VREVGGCCLGSGGDGNWEWREYVWHWGVCPMIWMVVLEKTGDLFEVLDEVWLVVWVDRLW